MMKHLNRFLILIPFLLSGSVFAEEAPSSALPNSGASNSNSSIATPAPTPAAAADEALDPSVKITAQDKIGAVFQDVVVVQRKAKVKAKKILFAPSFALDFSDGPITMYALNTDVGYAFSDYFEAYLNLVPAFVTNERSIVSKVSSLTLQGGAKAAISYSKPTSQVGVNLLWIPAYGKDSWGPYSIVRSDTFFKFGAAMVTYGSDSGQRYLLQLGKTYFINNWFNVRVAGGTSYIQTVVDGAKSFSLVGILEGGLVFYF